MGKEIIRWWSISGSFSEAALGAPTRWRCWVVWLPGVGFAFRIGWVQREAGPSVGKLPAEGYLIKLHAPGERTPWH